MAKKQTVTLSDRLRAFLTERDVAMTDRQFAWAVAFCDPERATFRSSVLAARKVGYPDPRSAGDDMYDLYGQVLVEFIKSEEMMAQFIVSGLVGLTGAMTTKHFANMGIVIDSVDVEDNATRLGAFKELSAIFITKAATRNEHSGPEGAPVQHQHTVSKTLLEDKINALLGVKEGEDFL